jgi:prevent-host-death family protein
MHVTATDAKNRFGYLCAQAKAEPVIVEKDGRPDSVIVSYEEFQALKLAASRKAPSKSMAQRKREFNEKHKVWLAEQHRIVEELGVFGEEYRVW